VWDTVSIILNSRYNDELATIITTNYPDFPERDRTGTEDVLGKRAAEYAASKATLGDRITDRMRSRLQEMCRTVSIKSADYRPKKVGRVTQFLADG
jgi:DNA replication protein DnaC